MKIGVLALQGDVREHSAALAALGADPVEVRRVVHLAAIDGIVLPGGESTAISHLLVTSGLFEPLAERLKSGLPAFGTCAGMILLAADVLDGRPDQRTFGAIDIGVRRNAFGRQVDSFETAIAVTGIDPAGGLMTAVFIRAPQVERVGSGVEILAAIGDQPVVCRQGPVMVAAFHPELAGDLRLHDLFLAGVTAGANRGR